MDYWAETMQDDLYELSVRRLGGGQGGEAPWSKKQKGSKEVKKSGIEGAGRAVVAPGTLYSGVLRRRAGGDPPAGATGSGSK